MNLMEKMKVRAALLKHQRGNKEEAMIMYEALYKDNVLSASYMLPYSVLLLRSGREGAFEKVREVLVKAQKAPDLTSEKRQQLMMNYAIAVWKLGDLDKAISALEASHRKEPNGMTYQTLGFLYIEAGDADKALAYNLEALEYDDEDAITLDNLGQVYERMLGDSRKAREYFEKAHQIRPKQIDTLYFLAKYDEEEGKLEQALERMESVLDSKFSPLNHVDRPMALALVQGLRKKLGRDQAIDGMN